MNGLAVIREAQRRRRGLRAILLTGFVSNAAEIAVSGALSGSFSLVRKPATISQLAERVAMLLEAQPMGGNAPA
jgi:ActR/RegA family two-component response regulator